MSDPVPGFSSGLQYEKQCVQIVPTIFERMNSLATFVCIEEKEKIIRVAGLPDEQDDISRRRLPA